MDKINKDTLGNLISCELRRMREIWYRSKLIGDVTGEGAKFWENEIKKLEELDKEIWKYIE